MIEKKILLQEIDEALKDESTSPKIKELLNKVRPELVKAKTKEEYSVVILKIADIIGAIAKIGTIAQVISGSG